ncbi:efflux RND transporter periplasmic adaptor subunit [Nitratifractor sp.]
MTRKSIVIVLSILLAIAIAFQGRKLLQERRQEASAAATAEPRTIAVVLQSGKEGTLEERLGVLATIAAEKEIAIATKIAARILSVEVKESSAVRRGDLLVRLDDLELQSAFKSAQKSLQARKADLELARSIFRKNEKLYRIGGLSKEALQASKVALANKEALIGSAIAQIEQIKSQMSYLTIRAPFDGVVDRVLMHEGDLAPAGKPILRMQNGRKKLYFTFEPRTPVKVGQKLLLGDEIVAEVNRIYPSSQNALAQAEARIEKPLNLPTGSRVSLALVLRKERGCLFGNDTLIHKADGLYQMRYTGSRFEPVRVAVKLQGPGRYLLEECPEYQVAAGAEGDLALLPSYGAVRIVEDPKP